MSYRLLLLKNINSFCFLIHLAEKILDKELKFMGKTIANKSGDRRKNKKYLK